MLSKIKLNTLRRFSQTVFGLLLSNSYLGAISTKAVYSGHLKSICIPFLNCHACPFAVFSCPIGILQEFMVLQRIPIFLLGFFLVVGLTVGRAACGWLCPFGLIQDWMYKIKSKKYGIPKIFNYTKYVILFTLVLLIPYLTAEHWFSKLCPCGGLFAAVPWIIWNPIDPKWGVTVIDPGMIGTLFYIKIAILLIFLLWFIFSKRPFCRVACPLGAIWGIFNKVSLLKVRVSENCQICSNCKDICPMDLEAREEADTENCIKCFECTSCKHIEAKFTV